MVISDFHPLRPLSGPGETYSILVVDSDTVLALAVSVECLQAVSRRDSERREGNDRVQLVKLALRDSPQLRGARTSCRLGVAPIEDILRPLIIERPNHPASATGRDRVL